MRHPAEQAGAVSQARAAYERSWKPHREAINRISDEAVPAAETRDPTVRDRICDRDRLIEALRHLARRWRLPMPGRVRADRRYPAAAWFLPDRPGRRGSLLGASPVAFRVRLIFTGPDPLQRARFPHRRGTVEFPPSLRMT